MDKIAILAHGGIGGGSFSQGQPAIQNLVERLATRFEVDVFTVHVPNPDFLPHGYRIYHSVDVGPRIFRWIYLMALFTRHHMAGRYQIVYAFWGYPAGLVAVTLSKVCGIPSVVHLQGGDAVSLPRLGYGVFHKPLQARLCRWTYDRSTTLIALTAFQASCLRRNGITKVPLVIPFGVDTDLFALREIHPPGDELRFISVGNQTPVKGQDVMLRAFARIVRCRPARLTIVGGDFYEGHLKTLCASLEIEPYVTFLGPQPHPSMPLFYREADILLHTSWYEGQGIVIAEAAACGIIVAGTRVGMAADMGDDCVLTVETGEADKLADEILALAAAPARVRKMQRRARRWVEEKNVNYTERRIVETLNALLHANVQQSEAPTFQA